MVSSGQQSEWSEKRGSCHVKDVFSSCRVCVRGSYKCIKVRIYHLPAPGGALISRYSLRRGKRKSSDLVSEIRFPRRGNPRLQTLSDWQKDLIYKWIHDIFYPSIHLPSGECFLLSRPFLMTVISAFLFLVVLQEGYFCQTECEGAWLFPQHRQRVWGCGMSAGGFGKFLGIFGEEAVYTWGGSTHNT